LLAGSTSGFFELLELFLHSRLFNLGLLAGG
jgi:hypothetical protein